MIAFHGVESMNIYLYACVTYVTMRKLCLSMELSQLMGRVCNRTYVLALYTNRKQLVAYIETVTNNYSTWFIFLKFYKIEKQVSRSSTPCQKRSQVRSTETQQWAKYRQQSCQCWKWKELQKTCSVF